MYYKITLLSTNTVSIILIVTRAKYSLSCTFFNFFISTVAILNQWLPANIMFSFKEKSCFLFTCLLYFVAKENKADFQFRLSYQRHNLFSNKYLRHTNEVIWDLDVLHQPSNYGNEQKLVHLLWRQIKAEQVHVPLRLIDGFVRDKKR